MLAVTNLRKTYGETVGVEDVSFEIRKGEIFGLLGPNGAGKSTTIGAICGILHPDSGSVHIDGAGSPDDPRVRERIGVAPQSLSIYDTLSGRENLMFFGRMYGLRGSKLRQRCDELLELVGLTERASDRASAYSGGMQRRLNLAIALMHSPAVLLLDEPTAGVDPQSRNAIFEVIKRLRSKGTTIVYTTHYMEEAERLCDRIAIIDSGRVLTIGTLDELLAAHNGKTRITIERAGKDEQHIETDDPMAALTTAITEGEISGLRIDRPDLETIFLSLTGRSLRD